MAEPVYNASMPKGGDPTKVDVNAQYVGFEYNYVYITTCAFIVWLIIPGIGLLYSGLARRKSALALLFQSLMIVAVDGGPFIGSLKNFGLMDVMVAPSPGSPVLPEIVFCYFQLLFCVCTVLIVVGGSFERGNILPSLIFSFFWATIVYCPLARWTWSSSGWLYNLPSLDFAGGGPVHIASGWSALAYALILGKRKHHGEPSHGKPHNTSMGGSSLGANMRAMLVVFNTNAAASIGVLGWVLVDFIKHKGKFSLVGACEGAIAGLVGITPAAGFVSVWLAACIAFITSVVCALLQDVNDWLNIDEGLDVFKLHGVGGMVGAFLTGIFASESISSLDGATFSGGAIDGNGVQVGKQLAEVCAISGYSFAVTCILLYILKFIPGMKLRVDETSERVGLDRAQFFDEQIGDWTMFDSTSGVVFGSTSETMVGVHEAKDEQQSSDKS
ncbi:hypothetical protein MW887_002411 [Aspergillus wentii]|nr:hypothetical protein MW887_002411 [Aspergillus wentii]